MPPKNHHKHEDFIQAARLMQVGDPPLRWTCVTEKEARNLSSNLDRYVLGGFWRHFLNGELWVIRHG